MAKKIKTKGKKVKSTGTEKPTVRLPIKPDYDMEILKRDGSLLEDISNRRNKNKTLVLMSRKPTVHTRFLLKNIEQLVPNVKKESKWNPKDGFSDLVSLAIGTACSSILLLQTVKHRDYYMWLVNLPQGPSIKFQVLNIHNIQEMKTVGNALQYSRSILSFSKDFEELDELRLVAEMLSNAFNVPMYHKLSKPFVDRVIHFSYKDGKIQFRHYQIRPSNDPDGTKVPMDLLEIGPRFALEIIRIFGGTFGGPMLYKNENYLTPVQVRKQMTAKAAMDAKVNRFAKAQKEAQIEQTVMINEDQFDVTNVFSDAESDESDGEDAVNDIKKQMLESGK